MKTIYQVVSLGAVLSLSFLICENQIACADNDRKQVAMVNPFAPSTVQKKARSRSSVSNPGGQYLKAGDEGYATGTKRVPPEFPVPMIPGGKLVSADDVVIKGGHGYYVRYSLPHDNADVINWYLTTFNNSGWQVPKEGPRQDVNGHVRFSAQRPGASAGMMFARSSEPGARTDVIINVTTR